MTNVKNGVFTFLGHKIQIDPSWDSFFNANIQLLQTIEKTLAPIKNKICPTPDKIFRVFRMSVTDIKFVILGLDPYPEVGVATGLGFDIDKPTKWDDDVPKSMENILKELYFLKGGNKNDNIQIIRNSITSLNIPSPDQLIKKWETNGVFMLNIGLTITQGISRSHLKHWGKFIRNAITLIDSQNINIEWLVWGSNSYQKTAANKINKSNKVFLGYHPTARGGLFVGNSKIQKINQYQKIFY
ncbi:hypothetical protein KMW28_12680 [Flammeovirga yaeyamensis]|uniref:Uracil-DNA glycosylase n=1 Tax=Flammeovirga yaeyamensis TaxID=367791 RepID=A0AAX1MYV7_9BACT|nr:hypothetical protein [Flammeovirga yaeyamensis]MBB3695976.1 uracil-DNA glycosylase [Flammeovirga yaeyamensis]NMF34662.1 hypothetical protein [Flammeovirga yaeyamensis]QWG00508.1 hypothetical protein KMW28_12680 [Flammeovirga yaeyamensis]